MLETSMRPAVATATKSAAMVMAMDDQVGQVGVV